MIHSLGGKIVGKTFTYGVAQINDIETFRHDLLYALPEWKHKSDYVKNYTNASAIEFAFIKSYLDTWIANYYLTTATREGIFNLVLDYGIDLKGYDFTDSILRNLVLAQFKLMTNDFTLPLIAEIMESFPMLKCIVFEDYPEYSVHFNITGNAPIAEVLGGIFEKALPAHLVYSITTSYTWDNVRMEGDWQYHKDNNSWGSFVPSI